MATTDYNGTSDQPFPAGTQASRFNVVARFPNPDAAASAIQRVRQQGIAEQDVSMLGQETDMVRPETGLSRPDEKVVKSVVRQTTLWMAGGAVIGAVLGIIIMLLPPIRSLLSLHITAAAFVAAAVIGAVVGAICGFLVGYVAGLDESHADTDPYTDQVAKGIAMVGVHAEDEQHIRAATEAFHASGALSVDTVGTGV